MTYIKQDHQVSVTLNEVDESSILLSFNIYFLGKAWARWRFTPALCSNMPLFKRL